MSEGLDERSSVMHSRGRSEADMKKEEEGKEEKGAREKKMKTTALLLSRRPSLCIPCDYTKVPIACK